MNKDENDENERLVSRTSVQVTIHEHTNLVKIVQKQNCKTKFQTTVQRCEGKKLLPQYPHTETSGK